MHFAWLLDSVSKKVFKQYEKTKNGYPSWMKIVYHGMILSREGIWFHGRDIAANVIL
jgi:hypothetical protein